LVYIFVHLREYRLNNWL